MALDLPLVSVGMPVFNEERTITRALDSLLAQTYPNFEIIISDNCSTDSTAKICKEYAKTDTRIQLNLNKKNLGIVANFQIVYRKGSGKYFMWAAGDDYWEPEFLTRLVNELESDQKAGVALCAVRREHPDGSMKDIIRFDGMYDPGKLSHWQVASRLLSPRKQVRLLKYNQFMYGIFRYEIISDIFTVANDINYYGERAFLALISLAYRFRYFDEILFLKTVQESFGLRYPSDDYKKAKRKMTNLKYYAHYYSKLTQYIISYSDIPLRRKFFVLLLLYYMTQRFVRKQKKKIRKALHGKKV